MALKLNKYLYCFAMLFFIVCDTNAQYSDDTSYYEEAPIPESDTIEDYTDETIENISNYNEYYHFNDSDVYNHRMKVRDQKLDKSYWLKESDNINFNEDTAVKKSQKNIKQKLKSNKIELKNDTNFSLNSLKNIWIILALVILLALIIFMVPALKKRNQKFKETVIIINFDDLDEQTLRYAEFEMPLINAIRLKDFRTAYRLRYLAVLQKLISKNLIFYKKEKTNYEYLLQLTGKNIYEPFRMLTFNFDGIWYGELPINESVYNELNVYFLNFETHIKN